MALTAQKAKKGTSTGKTTGEPIPERGMLPDWKLSKEAGIAMCEERVLPGIGESPNRPDQDSNVNRGVRSNISKE